MELVFIVKTEGLDVLADVISFQFRLCNSFFFASQKVLSFSVRGGTWGRPCMYFHRYTLALA